MDWKIYYADGSTYVGDPYQAPAFGVILVIENNPESGHTIVAHNDYYIWRDPHWYSVDFIGMVDYLQEPGAKRVLFGRLVDNQTWQSIYQLAENDPDFQRRTSFTFAERKLTSGNR